MASLLIAAPLLSVALAHPLAVAKSPPPSLVQRIRNLVGLNRPVTAGGSRGNSSMMVCVIAPHISVHANGEGEAVIPLAKPSILVAAPLNEIRIVREGVVLWQRHASSAAAIEGPINWPTTPVGPGETLSLLLRPVGASGGDFARVTLKGASASERANNESMVRGLGKDPSRWLHALDRALSSHQVEMALALLYSPDSPQLTEFSALRSEMLKLGCRRT